MDLAALTELPILTLILWLPLLGTLLCLLMRHSPVTCRWLALFITCSVLLLTVWLFIDLPISSGWLLQEDHAWIPQFGIRYSLALDGISLLLICLTALLQVAAVLISWKQKEHPALFYALVLVLETGIIGVFLATDLILFYVFWELMLIPMLFLIGIWGHENRVYAALKFFFFTLAGSLCLLVAIISLYLIHGGQTGVYSFAADALRQTQLSSGTEMLLYLGFLLAFVVKVPLFPFHTWLPDAHTEAPAAGSVDLAGLLLKTGIYGLIRFAFPFFPHAARQSLPLLAGLALIGIFYAAWIAYAQSDIKRVIAYSSVAHMGFVILGLAAWNQLAWDGALLLMVNHGVTTGGLFLLIAMIQDRTGSRDLRVLGGLWKTLPFLGAFFLLFCLASLGLPGLSNFAGEILVLLGTFGRWPLMAALAAAGVIFSAAYMLRVVQGTLWGPLGQLCKVGDKDCLHADLDRREWLLLIPLGLLVIWLGIYPTPVLERMSGPISLLLKSGGLP
ncbi:complex I subunit 4 family protein [Geopsychrobacter electrodiphilus]|uniref:complex I subunit 4 family protein n=1 Tax=Geopsychrobacter electrodiphilus TaxID=225196 RepID=UPI000370EDE4|nr:NADH-quinone oxidoreductase subunit M [Geopsychrobacter electrodiphilus]